MSRADIAVWNAIASMPITMDGVNDGICAIIFITLLIVVLASSANKPRYRSDRSDYPLNRPPHYPPWY